MPAEERFARIESILDRRMDRQQQRAEILMAVADSHLQIQEQMRKIQTALHTLADEQTKTEAQMKALGLVVEATERQ